MTRAFREALRRLGISQPQAAAYLGVGERTVRRWCRDDGKEPDGAVSEIVKAIKDEEDFYARTGFGPVSFTKRDR